MDIATVPFLVFRLNGAVCGVRSAFVREIIWLPELTPVEEAPPYIAGLFNLRGRVVPVMDLNLRFGHKPRCYRASDSVIVIEAEGSLMGVVVDEALDVNEIPLSDVEAPETLSGVTGEPHFIEGEAKIGERIIMILDAAKLVKHGGPPLAIAGEPPAEVEGEAGTFSKRPVFCPDASQSERELFRDRARNLSRKDEVESRSGLVPIAVVGVGGEILGIDAGLVREFADVRRTTLVPCCPPHVLGDMNLRGNIITVVDIRGLLAIPTGGPALFKAVITEMGESLVGIAVGEVLDIAYLRGEELVSAPTGGVADKYIKGTASYAGRLMTVLDVEKFFNEGALEVNEEV
ncbi:MAG: purine-binding chemotaxis protein CheW [Nitrospinae bacterium]|nr:purine-binding chemotaxis protein CheW [Nitrospinota bacterium]